MEKRIRSRIVKNKRLKIKRLKFDQKNGCSNKLSLPLLDLLLEGNIYKYIHIIYIYIHIRISARSKFGAKMLTCIARSKQSSDGASTADPPSPEKLSSAAPPSKQAIRILTSQVLQSQKIDYFEFFRFYSARSNRSFFVFFFSLI